MQRSSEKTRVQWTPEQLARIRVVVRGGPLSAPTNDPETALAEAWSARAGVFARAMEVVPARVVQDPVVMSAIQGASAFLEGRREPLSATVAAVALELLALGGDRAAWSAFSAVTGRSLTAYGPLWILDLVAEAAKVVRPMSWYRKKLDKPTFEHVFTDGAPSFTPMWPEGSGPAIAVFLFGFTRLGLSDPDHAALSAGIVERFQATASWPERTKLVSLLPEATPLADHLAEEWLATNGRVPGYPTEKYAPARIAAPQGLKYSHPLAMQLIERSLALPWNEHYLVECLEDLVVLYGEGALPMIALHLGGVRDNESLVRGIEAAAMIRSVESAAIIASQLAGTRKARALAQRWLDENPALAAAVT